MTGTRPLTEQLLTEYGSAIDLEFVRNVTGIVHIVTPQPPAWARAHLAGEVLSSWSEAAKTLPSTRMVCGYSRFVDLCGEDQGRAHPIGTFDDGDLCARCVRGLGSESSRAFEHPQPEEVAA